MNFLLFKYTRYGIVRLYFTLESFQIMCILPCRVIHIYTSMALGLIAKTIIWNYSVIELNFCPSTFTGFKAKEF